MVVKRTRERSSLSRQEIAVRRRQLHRKRLTRKGAGRRALAAVFLAAASLIALLSVATFSPADRLGPGFENAVGPVGHAIAEALRGALGLCAYVVPLLGLFATGLVVAGDREKRRWPQILSAAILVLCTAVLAQLLFHEDSGWAHAPGGLLGRELATILTALFSRVGTLVLVTAGAMTAFIVGTEFTFLRLCSWCWDKAQIAARRGAAWLVAVAIAGAERARELRAARKAARERARAEEAAFLAELEREEAELDELERAAAQLEAEQTASAEETRAREEALLERERARAERERTALEREAARLAKDAVRLARQQQKSQRDEGAVAALAPELVAEVLAEPGSEAPAERPATSGADPAWVTSIGSMAVPSGPDASEPALARAGAKAGPAPSGLSTWPLAPEPEAGRAPDPPWSTAEATDAPEAVLGRPPDGNGAAASGPQLSSASLMPGAGATALARMPVIVEPKAPPRPTAQRPQFELAEGRTGFDLPPVDVLEAPRRSHGTLDKDAFLETAARLTTKLRDFDIDGEVVEIRPGPVVTMYEFRPAPGVKISKIASLADDLAMAMEAMRVRIVAPIPGKGVVGVEVPNRTRESVFLKEVAEQDTFQKSPSRLAMCLGKDIEGMPYVLDLGKAPHLLMAGTTGSGKSVSVNSMIMSLLLKATPEEVRFIMVDPKMLELSVYEGIPHLLLPVVTDPRKAAVALQWAVEEMTRRYRLLAEAGVRNIAGYNELVAMEQRARAEATAAAAPAPPPERVPAAPEPQGARPKRSRRLLIVDAEGEAARAPRADPVGEVEAPGLGESPRDAELGASPLEALSSPDESVLAAEAAAELEAEIRVDARQLDGVSPTSPATAAEPPAGEPGPAAATATAPERTKMPYIVVIIDELADLMMVASKEVETSIARLAQMARAAGIHLMVATQRPSTDVVTGLIKANFPTRISFMLRTKIDSMTILGATGAEALLGMGDMLILPPTSAHLQRVHGCFVSEAEIKRVVDHLKAQGKPVYDESILAPRDEESDTGDAGEDELSDELYDQAIAVVSEMKTVSISMLQRKMRIGYNRAARMIERMERDGMVGSADGAKPREVFLRPIGAMPGAGAL